MDENKSIQSTLNTTPSPLLTHHKKPLHKGPYFTTFVHLPSSVPTIASSPASLHICETLPHPIHHKHLAHTHSSSQPAILLP